MTNAQKAVFLDRDGVINQDDLYYTYRVEDFRLFDGVAEALRKLKDNGFVLAVITNQAGISKGLYTHDDVRKCHDYMMELCAHLFDGIYYSPYHPSFSNGLGRKPDSLLFEKAIAKFGVDPGKSWMVGDKERDLIPARKLGMNTLLVGDEATSFDPDGRAPSLKDAVPIILDT